MPKCQSTLTTSRSLKRKTSLWWAACFCTLFTSVTSYKRLQQTSRRWGTERTCRRSTRVCGGYEKVPGRFTSTLNLHNPARWQWHKMVLPILPTLFISSQPLLTISHPAGAITERAFMTWIDQGSRTVCRQATCSHPISYTSVYKSPSNFSAHWTALGSVCIWGSCNFPYNFCFSHPTTSKGLKIQSCRAITEVLAGRICIGKQNLQWEVLLHWIKQILAK